MSFLSQNVYLLSHIYHLNNGRNIADDNFRVFYPFCLWSHLQTAVWRPMLFVHSVTSPGTYRRAYTFIRTQLSTHQNKVIALLKLLLCLFVFVLLVLFCHLLEIDPHITVHSIYIDPTVIRNLIKMSDRKALLNPL